MVQYHMRSFLPRRAARYKTVTRLPVYLISHNGCNITQCGGAPAPISTNMVDDELRAFLIKHDIVLDDTNILLPQGLILHLNKGHLHRDIIEFSIYLKDNKTSSLARGYGQLHAANMVDFILEVV